VISHDAGMIRLEVHDFSFASTVPEVQALGP